jgi:hypothetical protein
LESTLRGGGYEVYRTPDETNLDDLVTRLRPDVVIVSLDSPWVDVTHVIRSLTAGRWPVPVLLIGDAPDGSRFDGTPRIPLAADAATLLASVERLRTVDNAGRE